MMRKTKSIKPVLQRCPNGCIAAGAYAAAAAALFLPAGCGRPPATFQQQKTANEKTDWTLATTDPNRSIDAYLPKPGVGQVIGADGDITARYISGEYKDGNLVGHILPSASRNIAAPGYTQTLDLKNGTITTAAAGATSIVHGAVAGYTDWNHFWADSDIQIAGDPDAQQATRAELFYLAGSASPNASIPPYGLSSNGYKGHIFWDAETWMLPALIVQHPNLARGIILYRYQRLAQAKAIAAADHLPGAEYPWESADTGKEEAPQEFAQERHITADIALAAWQYYLWTGDKQYLKTQGWPVLRACAEYWSARAIKSSDGKYHILHVMGPDETSEIVDDDSYTNAAAAQCLRDAILAAATLQQPIQPRWLAVASGMALPRDPATGAIIEYAGAINSLQAKQADTQLLLYPLDIPMPRSQAASLLTYAIAHTITVGPAMTSSINATIAARLGQAQQSVHLFRASYQPFLRAPWNAFSEKRTRDNIYFCTGMGGCLQTVLYGYAGLNIVPEGTRSTGKRLARIGDAALYADPHLPPGWTSLIIRGIKFRGREFDLTVTPGNSLTVHQRSVT